MYLIGSYKASKNNFIFYEFPGRHIESRQTQNERKIENNSKRITRGISAKSDAILGVFSTVSITSHHEKCSTYPLADELQRNLITHRNMRR